ncbi:hypothetical protein M434DRAFT_336387 [Hypoxylon sp. CO27-5]|nr:hypothetical protein M434DRAFT_336387 [Hypoxylon sp. CO27-5]
MMVSPSIRSWLVNFRNIEHAAKLYLLIHGGGARTYLFFSGKEEVSGRLARIAESLLRLAATFARSMSDFIVQNQRRRKS